MAFNYLSQRNFSLVTRHYLMCDMNGFPDDFQIRKMAKNQEQESI